MNGNTPACGDAVLERSVLTYSIVIPVYNSAPVVGTTIDRVVEVFEEAALSYELILVNDGSSDGSWDVISTRRPRRHHLDCQVESTGRAVSERRFETVQVRGLVLVCEVSVIRPRI